MTIKNDYFKLVGKISSLIHFIAAKDPDGIQERETNTKSTIVSNHPKLPWAGHLHLFSLFSMYKKETIMIHFTGWQHR